jgi:predicted RNA-binding protein (virulence factor B family)
MKRQLSNIYISRQNNKMNELLPGKSYNLTVVKRVEFGVYLAQSAEAQLMGMQSTGLHPTDKQPSGADPSDLKDSKVAPGRSSHDTRKPDSSEAASRVLLPAKQVPDWIKVGDALEVFLYRDSSDRLIATTRTPMIRLGEVAHLKVSQTGKIGAFLDWGLEKDLLLPYADQTCTVKAGDEVLVALYLDKSSRLAATMNVYPYLKSNSPYILGDEVKGTAYQDSERFGVFVAVDDKYQGLIPRKEAYGDIRIGYEVKGRVIQVREDGKLDLSVRRKAYEQINDDAEAVLELIRSYDGALPFNDKAAPGVIKLHTGMSKNEFKRAVGHLLKEGLIVKTDTALLLSDR